VRNEADSRADSDRFIRRVVEADLVWYLTSDRGSAISVSNELVDEHGEPVTVILFFSDRAYAERVQASCFPTHEAASIDLFDFLYRWLPGMSGDHVLAGPNWTGDLVGLEFDPIELSQTIAAAMSEEHLQRHEQMFQELGAAE